MIKLEAAVEGKWNVWYEEVDYEKEILWTQLWFLQVLGILSNLLVCS
jgi:hypothetical protein